MNARFTFLSVWAIALACCCASAGWSAPRVLHKERSLYQTILVVQDRNLVCLQFSVKRAQRNQSCMDRKHPRRMQFSYTKMMMAALLLNSDPKHILMVGLGGGTLPTALHELYPQAKIDAVEIDPGVIRMARQYFDFTTNALLKVHQVDARVFTKRARLRGAAYDLILLDAYNGDYIPEHLLTVEYLQENKAILTPDGVLAANTFAVSDLYDHESATYAAVFGKFYNFKLWNSSNRVVIARPSGLPEVSSLKPLAQLLAPRLAPYNVPIAKYPKDLDRGVDWQVNARVLTDQYSPANLLKHR